MVRHVAASDAEINPCRDFCSATRCTIASFTSRRAARPGLQTLPSLFDALDRDVAGLRRRAAPRGALRCKGKGKGRILI